MSDKLEKWTYSMLSKRIKNIDTIYIGGTKYMVNDIGIVALAFVTNSGSYKSGILRIDENIMVLLYNNNNKFGNASAFNSGILLDNGVIITKDTCKRIDKKYNRSTHSINKLYESVDNNAKIHEITNQLLDLAKERSEIIIHTLELNKNNEKKHQERIISTIKSQLDNTIWIHRRASSTKYTMIELFNNRISVKNIDIGFILPDNEIIKRDKFKQLLVDICQKYIGDIEAKSLNEYLSYPEDPNKLLNCVINSIKNNDKTIQRSGMHQRNFEDNNIEITLESLIKILRNTYKTSFSMINKIKINSVTDKSIVVEMDISHQLGDRKQTFEIIMKNKKKFINAAIECIKNNKTYNIAPLQFYKISSIKFLLDNTLIIEFTIKIDNMDKEVDSLDLIGKHSNKISGV